MHLTRLLSLSLVTFAFLGCNGENPDDSGSPDQPDFAAPRILSSTPADQAVDIPVDLRTFEIQFNVELRDVPDLDLMSQGPTPEFSWQLGETNDTVVVLLSEDMAYDTVYTVGIDQDTVSVDGVHPEDYLSFSFTTAEEVEVLPEFEDAVLRVMYEWHTRGTSSDSYNVTAAAVVPIAVTDIDADPSQMTTLYKSRRLIGDDCVAYLDQDLTDAEMSHYYQPTAFDNSGDFGPLTVTFEDDEGQAAFVKNLEYVSSKGKYDRWSELLSYDGSPSSRPPTAGDFKVYSANPASSRTTTHDNTSGTVQIPSSFSFGLDGFDVTLPVDQPGAFMNFIMVGSSHRATIYCASQGSGGSATISVPPLQDIASEIDWSSEKPTRYSFGSTNVTDPLLTGPFGLIEQALNGPVRVAEGRVTYYFYFE